MPHINAHTSILGCHTCENLNYEEETRTGTCKLHNIPARYDTICGNMKSGLPFTYWNFVYQMKVKRGILYTYVDIPDMGYLPPTEIVPLEKIKIIQTWNSEENYQQAFKVAEKNAIQKYTDRLNKTTIFQKFIKFISRLNDKKK